LAPAIVPGGHLVLWAGGPDLERNPRNPVSSLNDQAQGAAGVDDDAAGVARALDAQEVGADTVFGGIGRGLLCLLAY